MDSYISISNTVVVLSLLLMVVVLLIGFIKKLGITKNVFVGTVRSFLQLFAMGYILSFIFDAQKWYYTALILIIMFGFASFDSYKRINFKPRSIFWISLIANFIGSVIPLAFMFYVVLRVKPWYEPQYIIPISAMVISNTMNSISICLNNFGNEMKLRRLEIETKLALGASCKASTEVIQKNSIKAGLIPTINALMVLGIVKLPGMMTGQILGGVNPVDSVKYQLLIMYMISAATAISLYILVIYVNRAIFSKRAQLLV